MSRMHHGRIFLVGRPRGVDVGGVDGGMSASTRAVPDRIFISYRREDTAYPVGWLFDRLADRFGQDQIFKDVDSID